MALMGALLPCAWLLQGGGQWLLSISPYPSLGPQGWPGGKSSAAVDSRHNSLSPVPLQHSPNNARSPCQVPSPQPRSADGVVLGEPSAGQRALDCEQHNDTVVLCSSPFSFSCFGERNRPPGRQAQPCLSGRSLSAGAYCPESASGELLGPTCGSHRPCAVTAHPV